MFEPSEHVNQLSYQVIGAAIEVHRHLGAGYLELVYERALAIELGLRQIPFERQVRIDLQYRGVSVGEAQIDLVVGDELVELKAVDRFHEVHRAQLISYLIAGGYQLGLLINFNAPRVKDGVWRVVSNPRDPFAPLRLCGKSESSF